MATWAWHCRSWRLAVIALTIRVAAPISEPPISKEFASEGVPAEPPWPITEPQPLASPAACRRPPRCTPSGYRLDGMSR